MTREALRAETGNLTYDLSVADYYAGPRPVWHEPSWLNPEQHAWA